MLILDIRVRYILLGLLTALNFLYYFNSPLTYSDAIECFGIECRPFSLINNLMMFTFLAAMMVSMGILNKSLFIPTYWFIPIIILGYVMIFLDWRNKKIVRPRPGRITPPPDGFLPKTRRILLIMGILLVHMALFFGNYSSHKVNVDSDKFSELIFWSAFGTFKERPGAFMTGWLSILGILWSMVNIFFTESFFPQKFNLPNSWRI